MGYTTDFEGSFIFDKELTNEQIKTIMDFADERHEGSKFPGYYCQWVVNEDGTELEWDGGEKFYNYKEWLEYLIKNFFIPWGVTLTGSVEWSGEESGDIGIIMLVKNVMVVKNGYIAYDELTIEDLKIINPDLKTIKPN